MTHERETLIVGNHSCEAEVIAARLRVKRAAVIAYTVERRGCGANHRCEARVIVARLHVKRAAVVAYTVESRRVVELESGFFAAECSA